MTITGGPSSPEVKVLPKHKKNAEVGEKKTVYTSTILVEQEDALSFEDQEEVRRDPICTFHRANFTVGHAYGLG